MELSIDSHFWDEKCAVIPPFPSFRPFIRIALWALIHGWFIFVLCLPPLKSYSEFCKFFRQPARVIYFIIIETRVCPLLLGMAVLNYVINKLQRAYLTRTCRWSSNLPGVAISKLTPFCRRSASPFLLAPPITIPNVWLWYLSKSRATPYVWRESSLVGEIMMTPVPVCKNQ